jgi:hypothetical protein
LICSIFPFITDLDFPAFGGFTDLCTFAGFNLIFTTFTDYDFSTFPGLAPARFEPILTDF